MIEELKENLACCDEKVKSLAEHEGENKMLTAKNIALKTQLTSVKTLSSQICNAVQPLNDESHEAGINKSNKKMHLLNSSATVNLR